MVKKRLQVKELASQVEELSLKKRLIWIGINFGVYIGVFVGLTDKLGPSTGALSALPVFQAARLLGMKAGFIATIVIYPITTLLVNHTIPLEARGAYDDSLLPGMIVLFMICLIVGRARDLQTELKQELKERLQAEVFLLQTKSELEKAVGQAQKHAASLESLRDTTAVITSTLECKEVLQRILTNLEAVLPHDTATIMMIDEQDGQLYVAGSRGYERIGLEAWINNFRIEIDHSSTFQLMAESGDPLTISDTQNYPDWFDAPDSTWTRSYAGAPIIFKNKLMGFLNLISKQPGFFAPEDAWRLRTFASQAAVAIENARLYDQAQVEIAERNRIEQALREEQGRYRGLFERTHDAVFILGLDGDTLTVNQRAADMLGYQREELIGKSFKQIISNRHIPNAESKFSALLAGVELPLYERIFAHKDGSELTVEIHAALVHDAAGNPMHVQSIVRDITDRKRGEAQFFQNAFYDELTGLPNRALFFERLDRAFTRAKTQKDFKFAILFLDLDRFKVINDSLGHSIGDQLLVAIARRLNACLKSEDTVARLGGDEFAILLENIHDIRDPLRVTNQIQELLNATIHLGGHEVFSTASIGITLSEPGDVRPDDLLRDADIAMYRAKQHGGGRHEIFDTEMHLSAVVRLQLETDLRKALGRDEFRIFYQPIIDLETHGLTGFEALIRWEHPHRGLLAPWEFILAEETGLILKIDRWVLRQACRTLSCWKQDYPPYKALTLAVNVSVHQLLLTDLVETVADVLRTTGFPAQDLNIEITESVFMEDVQMSLYTLTRLRELGVKINLDDFGTGYSSLSYLQSFPIDILKIDRSFINKLNHSDAKDEIVRAIIMLARNLELEVTAEGIESLDQLKWLQNYQCEYGQGFYFSKPVPKDQAESFLANGPTWRLPAPQFSEESLLNTGQD